MRKKYIFDCLLIGGMLLAALVSCLAIVDGKDTGDAVVVCVDGQEAGRYALNGSGRYELNGGSNILIIQAGAAYLENASCPDRLCVRQGKISLDGQVITCLPNRLTVTVYANNSEVELIS
jgi:hypothetical protein